MTTARIFFTKTVIEGPLEGMTIRDSISYPVTEMQVRITEMQADERNARVLGGSGLGSRYTISNIGPRQ